MAGRPVIHTRRGYELGEVVSALQKAVRRSEEERALFWALELEMSGYPTYAWRRLRIILSEDIGLAWPDGPAVIRALFENWQDAMKNVPKGQKDTSGSGARLFLVHAVLLMCRSEKSRLVDHALLYTARRTDTPEIPDEALDKHTKRGRQKKRGWDHFFEEGAMLNNESPDIEDVYRERARAALENQPPPEVAGQLPLDDHREE